MHPYQSSLWEDIDELFIKERGVQGESEPAKSDRNGRGTIQIQ
jgi:hypothetical protein